MHGPARAQIVGTSQAVCLFACSTSAAFGAVWEDVSGEALGQLPQGMAPGGIARARSRSDCGDVSGGLLVCMLNIRCLRSSLRGCLKRGAGFSLPKGPRLRGCLKRFACFGGQTRLRPKQVVRSSQAERWLEHPTGLRLREKREERERQEEATREAGDADRDDRGECRGGGRTV